MGAAATVEEAAGQRQWQRRRRRRAAATGRARAASSSSSSLVVVVVFLAAALFVAATMTVAVEAAAAPWASEVTAAASGGTEAAAAAEAAVGQAGAAAAAEEEDEAAAAAAATAVSSPARSLLQELRQQDPASAAAATTPRTQAEEDALAAAVAAAAAAIDPPAAPNPAGGAPFSIQGGGGAADATELPVLQDFTSNLAAQPWDERSGGSDGTVADDPSDGGANDADADTDADAPPADPSGPPLRPVPGAAAACSPQVGNGGASLVSAPTVAAAAAPEDDNTDLAPQPPPAVRCRLFEKVCLDHDSLVLYSPRHNPRHPSYRGPSPALELPGVRADYHSCDGAWGTAFDYPPPLVRPATPGEESEALSSPAFSRCSVPVLLFPSSLYELGDFFRNTVATVRGLQLAGLLDRRMTLAVAALGMRLEPWHAFFLRPFSAWQPTTISHLSSRLPSAQAEPYSPDGTHVRCFSQLLACPTPRYWAPAAAAAAAADGAGGGGTAGSAGGGRGLLAAGVGGGGKKNTSSGGRRGTTLAPEQQPQQKHQQQPPLWATGQDVLEHYRRELPPDGGIPIPGPGAPDEDPLYPHALRDPSKLRVIVAARRSRAARARLLNQEQVWSWCTKFAAPPGVGPSWNGTACALHEFGRDLPRDLALSSRADVLIAMHGPDLYLGALAMPRRSSVVEIRPYGFNATSDPRADAYFRAPLRAENDALFWWGVDVEDAAASKPGQRELEGRGDPAEWPRDRHATMRLVPLQYVMERVALSRRDADKYRAFRARGQAHVSDAAPPRNLGLGE